MLSVSDIFKVLILGVYIVYIGRYSAVHMNESICISKFNSKSKWS